MGIYSNGSIFGIGIYNFNNTLFEKTYNVLMNDEQKKEAYLFYTNLTNKNDIFFLKFIQNVVAHIIMNYL